MESAYDSLISSLNPLIAASMRFEDSQETINNALEAGYIGADKAAQAYDLAEERFENATAAAQRGAGVWADFKQAGGSAIDSLIAGTSSLTDALKGMIKELVLAITKKNLLGKVSGGSASDSVGGLIFKGFFGGFFDTGGVISPGQTGIVGERGPEAVTSTSRGTVVTSRVDTARRTGGARAQPQEVRLTGGNLTLSDDGKIMATVGAQITQGSQRAVTEVQRNLSSYQRELDTSGAMV